MNIDTHNANHNKVAIRKVKSMRKIIKVFNQFGKVFLTLRRINLIKFYKLNY